MLRYELIELNEKNIIELENLRFEVYDYKNMNFKETYFYREMINGNILPFGVYQDEQLIAGCYVSKSFQTLFIEQLFVLKKYQNNKEHIGSNLLRYVLNNKKICEEFFNTEFKFSYLDNRYNKSFYENLGYKENNTDMMFRRI